MDTMYNIAATEDFKADVQEIFEYISINLDQKSSALRLMSKIDKSTLSLREFPFSCPVCENQSSVNERRKLIVNNYIIIYEVNEQNKTVTLLNCVYARSDYRDLI